MYRPIQEPVGQPNPIIIMIKFIKNFFGVEATAKNIRGRKSNGCEDTSSYKNWRKERSSSSSSIN